MKNLPLVVLFFLLFKARSRAANILGMFTSTSPSHLIIHMATVKALVESGHNVTVVTVLPLKENNPGYHHLHVQPSEGDYAEYKAKLSDAASVTNKIEALKLFFASKVDSVKMQVKALRHPLFHELMNNTGNSFDVVMLGYQINTFQLGVAAHFNCSAIVSMVNYPLGSLLSAIGNPVAISSVPFLITSSGGMLFFKTRLLNFLVLWGMVFFEYFLDRTMVQYYDELFPRSRYPSYDEAKQNIALLFSTTHFSEGLVRPMVPGFVEIGGVQIKERPDPLPRDIEEFIKTADEGFILFSLGTNVKSTDLSTKTTLEIFKVLSQIRRKVLWKWDSTEPPGRSSNIMFRKWFPQDDILAHKKLQLFITHAGKGSVGEAKYHGVPMLAIPIYGDQHGIAKSMVNSGYGVMADHEKLTAESFQNLLNEVLSNSSYLQAVKKFSTLYRDRPISAKKSVVYWTEYVIRHRGAKHMQSPAVYMNFVQRNSLDVIGFLCLVLYLSFLVIRKTIRLLRNVISKTKIKCE